MPNRVIRDGLLSSDSFNALPSDAQMLYVRILLVVDDYGRFDGRDAAIKSACYPVSDIRLTDVSKMLTTLVGSRLIQRYDATGHTYNSVPRFNQRLRLNRERHPAPPEFECISYSYSDSDSNSDSDSDSDSGRHVTDICQTDDGHMSDSEISQETPLSNVVPHVDISKDMFDVARKAYPGTKRGCDTEYTAFRKHKDWREAISLLTPAIEREAAHKAALLARRADNPKQFVPEWAHFSTWINQRRWEQDLGPLPKTDHELMRERMLLKGIDIDT